MLSKNNFLNKENQFCPRKEIKNCIIVVVRNYIFMQGRIYSTVYANPI